MAQDEVLPRAHGGSGTTLATGVPRAFVPLFVDGPANAARVAELAAGIAALPPVDTGVELLQRSAAGHAIR